MTPVLLLALATCSAAPELRLVREHTSTLEVTSIEPLPSGEVRVGTRGGLLVRASDGRWSKTTRADGLQTNECLVVGGAVHRLTYTPPARLEAPPASATGTHVVAQLEDALAVFADGVFLRSGEAWRRTDAPTNEPTALARVGGVLWIGTRREGLIFGGDGSWQRYRHPAELPSHNVQSLWVHGGRVHAATLEDGLAKWTGEAWSPYHGLSSSAPRQAVPFQGDTYVRHGNGNLDRLEGTRIATGLQANLPRKQATCLATDGHRLFVGQYGGWSEFDGREWTHRFSIAPLVGAPTTCLLATRERIWIGTQGKGLVEVDRRSGQARVFDVRHGLDDDWVTSLLWSDGTLWIGTFARGLYRLRQGELRRVSLPNEAGDHVGIRFLVPGDGCAWVGTAERLYEVVDTTPVPQTLPIGPREMQAALWHDGTLWIADRTGLLEYATR